MINHISRMCCARRSLAVQAYIRRVRRRDATMGAFASQSLVLGWFPRRSVRTPVRTNRLSIGFVVSGDTTLRGRDFNGRVVI